MHDVKKVRLAELTEKEKRFNDEKIDKFKTLYDTCFEYKANKVYTRTVLEEDLNRLNEINPENTTMWNYRRTLLMNLWGQARAEAMKQKLMDDEALAQKLAAGTMKESDAAEPNPLDLLKVQVGKDLKFELELNTTIVKKDAKCYAAFVHRQWIIGQIQPATKRAQVLEMELAQCEKLLKLDERNFHAWGYRRWITTQLRELHLGGGEESSSSSSSSYSDEKEMKFTSTKIGNNMSNYSAWHNRALIFRRQLMDLENNKKGEEAATEKLVAGLEEEMALLLGAFYCDSKDQSAWLYAQWVMETLQKANPQSHQAKAVEVLASCQELLDAEEEDLAEQQQLEGGGGLGAGDVTPGFKGQQVLSLKWPLWFIIVLHRQLGSVEDGAATEEDIQKLVNRLCEVDAPRATCFRATLGKKSH